MSVHVLGTCLVHGKDMMGKYKPSTFKETNRILILIRYLN